jgi:hypothetical protein
LSPSASPAKPFALLRRCGPGGCRGCLQGGTDGHRDAVAARCWMNRPAKSSRRRNVPPRASRALSASRVAEPGPGHGRAGAGGIGALAKTGADEIADAGADEAAPAGAETGTGDAGAPAEDEPATGENDGRTAVTAPPTPPRAGTRSPPARWSCSPRARRSRSASSRRETRSWPPTPRPARTSPRPSPPSWSTTTPTSTTSPSRPPPAPKSSTPPATTCSATLIWTNGLMRTNYRKMSILRHLTARL